MSSNKKSFKWFISIPLVAVALGWGWLKRLAVTQKTPKALRDADQARQSRTRRELRGLSPEHDQSAARS